MDLTDFDYWRLWHSSGDGTKIHYTAIIYPGVRVGAGCTIGAYAVLGGPAEHREHFRDPGKGVVIGDGCFIGEHVTIHTGTTCITTVGEHCNILTKAQIGHDAILEQDVTVSCSAVIAGHAYVMRGANVGLGCKVNQRALIPPFTMLGSNAVVPSKMILGPASTYAGVPARFLKSNVLGLARAGLSQEEIQKEIERYHAKWECMHGNGRRGA